MVKRRSSSSKNPSCLAPVPKSRGKPGSDEIANAFKEVLKTNPTVVEPYIPNVDEELNGKPRGRR